MASQPNVRIHANRQRNLAPTPRSVPSAPTPAKRKAALTASPVTASRDGFGRKPADGFKREARIQLALPRSGPLLRAEASDSANSPSQSSSSPASIATWAATRPPASAKASPSATVRTPRNAGLRRAELAATADLPASPADSPRVASILPRVRANLLARTSAPAETSNAAATSGPRALSSALATLVQAGVARNPAKDSAPGALAPLRLAAAAASSALAISSGRAQAPHVVRRLLRGAAVRRARPAVARTSSQ